MNYLSAKGLEFDTVFIPELQSSAPDFGKPETLMQFYVLLSRARDELYLSYSGDETPACLAFLSRNLLEWR